MKHIHTIYDESTPFGLLRMTLINDELIGMAFESGEPAYPPHPTLGVMIHDYFEKKQPIVFPVRFEEGTEFQRAVWNAMLTIPLGKTRTYGQIAKQIGRPLAVRAVGQACKANPIGLVIPCHRVIGSDGSMRGYSGPSHVDLKEALLKHEGAIS